MNKSQLIDVIVKETDLKKKDAELAVNAFIDAIQEGLQNDEKIQLVGFGTFEVKQRNERNGRNPKTGESMVIPAAKYPVFTAGKSLKSAVNK